MEFRTVITDSRTVIKQLKIFVEGFFSKEKLRSFW